MPFDSPLSSLCHHLDIISVPYPLHASAESTLQGAHPFVVIFHVGS